jgi:hypothetical protein
MSVVEFKEPTATAVKYIADTMRSLDVVEVLLSHGHTPLQALNRSLDLSPKKWVAYVDGDPFVAFGVGELSLLSSIGSPWALASRSFADYRRPFAAYSRRIIADLRRGYEALENYVWRGNIDSIRWLRSCGFTLDPAAPHGPGGHPFHRFTMPGVL